MAQEGVAPARFAGRGRFLCPGGTQGIRRRSRLRLGQASLCAARVTQPDRDPAQERSGRSCPCRARPHDPDSSSEGGVKSSKILGSSLALMKWAIWPLVRSPFCFTISMPSRSTTRWMYDFAPGQVRSRFPAPSSGLGQPIDVLAAAMRARTTYCTSNSSVTISHAESPRTTGATWSQRLRPARKLAVPRWLPSPE